MLKQRTDLTPREKRIRRLRAVLYGAFAAFVVVLLFSVAWFGNTATRLNPRLRFVPRGEEPAGELSFQVASLAESARRAIEADTASAQGIGKDQLVPLVSSLGDEGQVFFWPSAARLRWCAYIPLRGPQRYRVEQVEQALVQSDVFVPEPARPVDRRADSVMGYFRLDGRGVIISSEPEFPDFDLVTPSPPLEHTAAYRAPGAFLPEFLQERFPEWSIVHELGSVPMERLALQWISGDGGGETRLSVIRSSTGAEQTETSPYFDPLIPAPGEESSSNE